MSRTRALAIAIAVGASFVQPVQAQAAYPSKPVRIIVPFAPGSGADAIVRRLSSKLAQQMGQTFVVENREGANGTIGLGVAAQAPADGYTLVYASNSTLAAAPFMYRKLPYAPADMVPIAQTGNFPSVFLVPADSPIRTLADLVGTAKNKPGALVYGYAQATAFAGGESFKAANSIEMEGVAYKGSATAMTDLIAGRLPLYISDFVTAYPQLKAGKVHALATTSSKRIKAWSSTPTLGESIPGSVDIFGWGVLAAPPGTPQAVVGVLNAEVNKALADPEVQAFYESIGADLVPGTPQQARAFVQSEMVKWQKVLTAAGVKPQ